jgi:glycine oxidase
MTPDGMPLLGRDPERPGIVYACGHGKNGILLAPITGECVASLLTGSRPEFDLSHFRVERFDSTANSTLAV